MKAEQRKELETNILADKMGLAVKRMKTRPRRTFLAYVFGIVAAFVIIYLVYRWMATERLETSYNWKLLYDGAPQSLAYLRQKDNAASPSGKAARLQVAWYLYWDQGVKALGHDGDSALRSIKDAGEIYESLAEDCKGDAVFEPQVLLGLAVVEEASAVQDTKHLKKASELYADVVSKYEKTTQGRFAQARIDELKKADVESLYVLLQKQLNIRPLLPPIAPKDKDAKLP